VLDAKTDSRYVLRIVACGREDVSPGVDDDRDYLEEIDDRLIGADEDLVGDEDEEITYDLCPECRRKFSLDPFGRRVAPSLDFSQN
jgi:hypothetical protein